ncbi:hypothetical protein [Halomicronema sp. CCY15110]|uniref:hypothetical protein n=1 Tax=Halomicronema sp. CCY15110 TaxID=2767773 RepID=UPI0019513CB5|nr:hypothetical protein [Halomicronema sp. CCY15110]
MLPKFTESLSGKLAERWLTTVFAPAFAFWLGGIAAWAKRFGWQPLVSGFNGLPEDTQLALLLGAFILVTLSGFLAQRFELTLLRWLEGYWPLVLRPLHLRLIAYQAQRLKRAKQQFQNLAQRGIDTLNPIQRQQLIALDWQLMQAPPPQFLMPTRLGNALRAAEQRPKIKYGLDAILCWPRLWFLLPQAAQQELETARDALNAAVRLWFWGILSIIWGIWTGWAVAIGLMVALFAYYRWILDAAAIYAALLESAFDLYRLELYKSLRWPLPATPAEELKQGKKLTAYLWRGSESATWHFADSDD